MIEHPDNDDSSMLLIWVVTGILAVGIIVIALFVEKKEPTKAPVQPSGIVVTVEEEPHKEDPPKQVKTQQPVKQIAKPAPQEVHPQPEKVEEPSTPPTFAELNTDDLPHLLSISSSRFQEKGRLPLQHSCYRTNESPPLKWTNAPEGTKSFALFMTRDNKDTPYVKWVLFNIAAGQHAVSRNLAKTGTLPDGSAQALSEHNNVGYTGPCEPKGRFRYTFRLFALDTTLDVAGGAKKDDVLRAMRGHVLDADEFPVIHYIRF